MNRTAEPGRCSLDEVIEAYKRHLDRSLLRENLKLSPEERIRKLAAVVRAQDELRRAGATLR